MYRFDGNAKNRSLAKLFAGWDETMIWSCLQGIMGEIYTDDAVHPKSAAAVLGDFCFLAGAPSLDFLTSFAKGGCHNFCIMVPASDAG